MQGTKARLEKERLSRVPTCLTCSRRSIFAKPLSSCEVFVVSLLSVQTVYLSKILVGLLTFKQLLLPRFYLWFTNNLVYYGLTFNLGKIWFSMIHRHMNESYVKMPCSGTLYMEVSLKKESFLYLFLGKLVPGNLHMNMMVSGALEVLAYTVAIFAFLR